MNWLFKEFEQLSLGELYDIMALRQEVFVVEQDCPYLDADGKDQESFHALAYENEILVAYARIVKPGICYKEWAIGRVIVKMTKRKQKLGYELMHKCHEHIYTNHGYQSIRLSAQSHLEKFYRNSGYKPTGKEYLEDGIPHMEMLRQ